MLGSIPKIAHRAEKKRADRNLKFVNWEVENAQTTVWYLQIDQTPKSAADHLDKCHSMDWSISEVGGVCALSLCIIVHKDYKNKLQDRIVPTQYHYKMDKYGRYYKDSSS